ncbi:ASKHA domain-containing protein [uncultured Algimonas sp.]|uniref:ASKHA domain-containing protein n=1 Tax=uncultured Algimonas sp. TaxID=1547920 RepID=UPI00260C1E3D|nr:ASKHA domain-containing protein [uncultured Algimonas sp.]
MADAAKHRIVFTPAGVQTTSEPGESVYDVALRAGVDIKSVCGGNGICKRCQCSLQTGHHSKFGLNVTEDALFKLRPAEKKAVHDGDMADGLRLACRAKIMGDVVIDIPPHARHTQSAIRKAAFDLPGPVDPPIRLQMVRLPEPTLHDHLSDTESLIEQLSGDLRVAPDLVTKIQPLLAEHDRTLIAVIRDETDVIALWPPDREGLYGAAIDIGSTSVALYLYDLRTGALVHQSSAMNPQIRFGEDVMSRVSYVMMNADGQEKLAGAVQGQLREMIAQAREAVGAEADQILELVCVGNPIMHHTLIGVDPTPLGQSPFTLAVKDWLDLPGDMLDLGLDRAARVSLLPLIGGHVGADTAAAYLTQMDRMDGRSVLLVDIGTNAELVLTHDGKVAAASSPTGPALEGAEISCGVRACEGAVERLRINPVTFDCQVRIIGHDDWLTDDTIGDHAVPGLCGSAIFEVMVELARAGLIDRSGLFRTGTAPDRFTEEGGVATYRLIGDITLKQTDIRAVQLAKAALMAGARLVAEELECGSFDEVLLAGAFGTHLDPDYVAEIGIIPHNGADTIKAVGNAAGMGAALCLTDRSQRDRIRDAVRDVVKIETALEPRFQDYFVEAMAFPSAPQGSGNAKGRRGGGRRGAGRRGGSRQGAGRAR